MWAQMMAPVLDADALEEHERRCRELGEICGTGRDPRECGQSWCVYYDAARRTCGLLAFDIPARLDRVSVSWLVDRSRPSRRPKEDELDEILATRCGSL